MPCDSFASAHVIFTMRSDVEAKLPYKDIVIYLDASPYLEQRLEVATAFAQKHGAKADWTRRQHPGGV